MCAARVIRDGNDVSIPRRANVVHDGARSMVTKRRMRYARARRSTMALWFVALILPVLQQDDPNAPSNPVARAPATLTADDARSSIKRGLAWLVSNQRESGAWGTGSLELVQLEFFSPETHYAFQIGANALAVRALLSADETPERRAALDKGLRWLCTTPMPKRGSDWDIDCSWSALY